MFPTTQSRKRRAQSDIHGPDAPSPPQRRKTSQASATHSRRKNGESSAQGAKRGNNSRRVQEEEEEDEDVDMENPDEDLQNSHGEMHKDRLTKNLVRLALSYELQRQPIKRQDISSKVLGSNGRQFKEIFALAQTEFKHVFGMELVELPMRDKTKLVQRRAAQTTDKGPSSSNSYILTSILGEKYKSPEIIVPHGFKEQTYIGLVTFVTSVIYLNGRVLPANKLHRYLKRLNAEDYTPLDRTEKVLQTMQKHGYIIRVKDNSGEETSYDYHLGPRAKVEIGEAGVKGLIKTVYGENTPDDLDTKFKRNVGVEVKANFDEDEDDAGAKKKAPAKRATRRRNNDEEEEGVYDE
ncbi:MAGE family-domain-containing protein [Trichophaea hybrida]|nr:MAGE family-domain-containing protein [Trichophaea hybrida]